MYSQSIHDGVSVCYIYVDNIDTLIDVTIVFLLEKVQRLRLSIWIALKTYRISFGIGFGWLKLINNIVITFKGMTFLILVTWSGLMSISKKINDGILRLERGDLTDMEFEAFVFYAETNLDLGSGFGNAISMRGGPTIKKELESIGHLDHGKAVVTEAGELKASFIVHAVGPKFQEENINTKLETTMISALRAADAKGIKQLAFPPMGANFYGIPLPDCAKIMVKTITEHLKGKGSLKDVVIVPMDNREFIPFEKEIKA